MWLFLVLFNILTVRHKRLKAELDTTSITPSDYTVLLTNVPKSSDEASLKEFLEVNGRPDGARCRVVKLNFLYRVSKLVEARVKQEALKEKVAMAEKQTPEMKPPLPCLKPTKLPAAAYQARLQEVEATIRQLEAEKFSEFTNMALATFSQDEGKAHADAKCVIKYLDFPELRSSWDVARYVFCPSRGDAKKNEFQGCKISTKRAPEPSDINWENIGVRATQVPKKTIFVRRLITWTATLVLLGASLLAIFFSSNVKSLLRSVYGPSSVSISDTLAYNVLSFLPSIIVVAINVALTFVIKETSKMEKHITTTNYNTSVAAKMTIAMFLNTAIVSFILHWQDFYTSHGLAAEIYNIMISNAVVQPFVYWLNFPFIFQKLYRRAARKKDEHCLMTQRQANKLYEGPVIDMPSRYATFMKTYLLTLVYAPMMPLSYFFGVVAMVIQYWVDKYMLLRVHSRPVRLSHDLDEAMLQAIPLGAIVYACTNWIFFAKYDDDLLVPGFVGVVTTVAYYCVPVKTFSKFLRLRKRLDAQVNPAALSESDKPYEDAAVDFVDDYDRMNPLTQEEGNNYWVNLILKKKGPEEARKVHNAILGVGSKRVLENLRRKSFLAKSEGGLAKLMGASMLSRKVAPAPLEPHPEPANESMDQKAQIITTEAGSGGLTGRTLFLKVLS